MSDELVWQERSPGEDNWRARNAFDDGTYMAYLAFERWRIYMRDNEPPVVSSDGDVA